VIIFRKLTFKNILSVGNTPVSVNLNETKTTLIHGTNGSGKSTILDALTYALFNKPFRKINLPQLLNSQNKKGLLTEVEFAIGRNEYMVRRGMKPKVFEVYKNGDAIDAKAADKDNQAHLEQHILKLSYKSFCQVVILGSASYTPFMQLNTANRRDCVEDFLDIKVFSAMSLLAKERLRGVKERLTEVKHDMNNLMYKIEVQQDHIKNLQHRQKSDSKQLEEIITSRGIIITQKLSLIEDTQENVRRVQGLLSQVMSGNPDRKLMELNKIIAKFETKADRLDKETAFFIENDDCPTCNQVIEKEVKILIESKNNAEKSKIAKATEEAVKQLDEFQGDMRVASTRQKHIDSLQKSIFEFETEVKSLQREVKAAKDKLAEMQMDTSCLDKEEGKLEVLKDNAKDLKKRYDSLSSEFKDHEVVVNLLKDSGIKTQIVKKYLPVMNNCIRRYLSELDLPVHFTLDDEFNEHVASPLHRDYSYASFSEGQKARIDLALCFTWREIGKLKNSVSTNILFLDEVFSSSLDDTGKELLMKIIRYNLPDNQNILVVDHTLSDNFKEKFDRSIMVTQVKGFSSYD
jgi:DNA repair exonuclease SbcCD ATPase subunit